MSWWTAAAIVLVVAAMTYAMRASVIVALAGRQIPLPVARALRQVGPAVLAALTINLAVGGDGGPGLELAEGAALVVAAGVAWWRRSALWSLVAGMTTLWLLSALL
jgi:branched-subunit amino acid transport protein